MEICRDRERKRLLLSLHSYYDKLMKKFHMENAKHVTIPLAQNLKLSMNDSPKNEEEVLMKRFFMPML